MDKMYLTILTDVRDDDFETMSCVTCPQNLIESELFVLILKNASNAFFDGIVKDSENLLNMASKFVKSNDIKTSLKGLQLLNKIISRTPTNTTVFLDALLARSVYFVQIQKYPLARSDLEYYKRFNPKLMTTEGILIVQTLLCLSLYLMRKMPDARLHLCQLEEVLGKLPANLLRENFELQTFLKHLEKYKKEIKQSPRNIQYKTNKEGVSFGPLNGSKFYNTPFMNCEVCGVYRDHLYTCTECRYKTYCSLKCIQSDWEEHQTECYGYKIGIIQMLEATLLFKIFIQATKYLSAALTGLAQKHGAIRNADSAWDFIVKYSKADNANHTIIAKFLSCQPDCNQLTAEKWRQLVTTGFRLAVFVYNDTDINDRIFSQLQMPKIETIKLIAALLMRLNVHITLNSQRNEFQYQQKLPASFEFLEHQGSLDSRINANAFSYHSINAHLDFVNCYNRLQKRISSTKHSSNQEGLFSKSYKPQTISDYIYKISIVCLKNAKIQSVGDLNDVKAKASNNIELCLVKLNTSMDCKLFSNIAEYFHKFLYDYFCFDGCRRHETTTICGNVISFTNFGFENCESRNPNSGELILMAAMNLRADVESTVTLDSVNKLKNTSYLEVMEHCKRESCSSQTMAESINNRHGIFCAFCEKETVITPALGKCPQCQITYSELFEQYTTFVSTIVTEIRTKISNPKTTRRDLTILYGTYNSYVTMHFSEGNAFRLSGVLSFIEFLTSNDFLNHACDIIFVLQSSDYFYAKYDQLNKDVFVRILKTIQKIMERYIETIFSNCCLDVNPTYPKMLLAITWHILSNIGAYLDIYRDDIEKHNSFVDSFTQYYKWKKIINSNLTMSVSLQKFLKTI
ncbi:uncharacterized protein LOC115764919 [Drosophila novamexicana]|uniref:uncharacterized protein LOC115764919 n=1 Tax=Drosophila novamexicana TaxID=47314 RepID=UPI0011E588D4|nr:uncharacterized protein LOC115764919 [Drosophila novamexicana]